MCCTCSQPRPRTGPTVTSHNAGSHDNPRAVIPDLPFCKVDAFSRQASSLRRRASDGRDLLDSCALPLTVFGQVTRGTRRTTGYLSDAIWISPPADGSDVRIVLVKASSLPTLEELPKNKHGPTCVQPFEHRYKPATLRSPKHLGPLRPLPNAWQTQLSATRARPTPHSRPEIIAPERLT